MHRTCFQAPSSTNIELWSKKRKASTLMLLKYHRFNGAHFHNLSRECALRTCHRVSKLFMWGISCMAPLTKAVNPAACRERMQPFQIHFVGERRWWFLNVSRKTTCLPIDSLACTIGYVFYLLVKPFRGQRMFDIALLPLSQKRFLLLLWWWILHW